MVGRLFWTVSVIMPHEILHHWLQQVHLGQRQVLLCLRCTYCNVLPQVVSGQTRPVGPLYAERKTAPDREARLACRWFQRSCSLLPRSHSHPSDDSCSSGLPSGKLPLLSYCRLCQLGV